ncbi:hypothetical protein PG999_009635 [Apiospora kogelbergensis]|uniref:Uncharacterized protein n=1 Tax=Apiospora kogelbergensis TaxID=1337665 RepID=A0AAW0QTC9_9PEZI
MSDVPDYEHTSIAYVTSDGARINKNDSFRGSASGNKPSGLAGNLGHNGAWSWHLLWAPAATETFSQQHGSTTY